ncbi:MBL fold metallo-hydrolase [Nocardia puris]|uniref:Metallo-beta-lactamase superfamily protein n=1 Tax=Nocardia puris TaxID=208602 RepID=A0A366D6G2_9NOCA|nr:MBL fold metallo-hydrolase [Nocardia puris]RBO85627.1 metallo-beta-lactamase superfamily protein [Nocardia puris]
MRIHHLDGGTMRPFGGGLLDGAPGLLRRAAMVCHCLLLEFDDRLALLETGMGEQSVHRPADWLGRRFVTLTRPVLDPDRTLVRQIEALGYRREDVRDIVLTHLDLDHAGGLADFPRATVHVYDEELRAFQGAHTAQERFRYRAAQFEHGPRWRSYADTGTEWFGFEAVRDLESLPGVLLVPLAGHTRGHTGIAVDTGAGWLFNAGDAYFHPGQLLPTPRQPLGITLFERGVETLPGPRRANQHRLRELVRDHGDEVRIFSAHNAAEFHAFQTAPATS